MTQVQAISFQNLLLPSTTLLPNALLLDYLLQQVPLCLP